MEKKVKPKTSRQIQAEASKRKIFNTAIDLFSQYAFEDITVSDICKAAGMSVGAFYHYFKNKESILNEGFRLFDLDIEQLWQEKQPAPGCATIEFLIHEQLRSMRDLGIMAASQYFKNQLSNAEKYIVDKDRFFYRTILENVQYELKQGRLAGDAGTICDDTLSQTRGIIYDWCLHNGEYDLLARGERAFMMVMAYYKTNKP